MVRLHALWGVAVGLGEAAVLLNSNKVIGKDKTVESESLASVASATVVDTLDTFASLLLDEKADMQGSGVPGALKTVSGQMDFHAAVKVIDMSSLPQDVSGLVQKVETAPEVPVFSEESLEKARVALNDLIEKAWVELDEKIFECKAFQDMNRNQYSQVTRDIMRLIEQINDLERVESEAIEGIAQKEQEIQDVVALLAHETKLYNIQRSEDLAELQIRQNDLDVFTFILKFTKCPDATSLAQTGSQVCETACGRKTLRFFDKTTAAAYAKKLTPRSKKSVDQILRSVETSLAQQPVKGNVTTVPPPTTEVLGEDGSPCASRGFSTMDGPMGSLCADSTAGSIDSCMKSCTGIVPDCGLLHDKLSLMWGTYKDLVDQLTMDMMMRQMEYEELKLNLNNQIRMLVTAKARFQQLLAEARANLAADRIELKQKYQQKRELDRLYNNKCFECKKRIQWILYQDMCAVKVVRNAVLENSTNCKAADISDCELDAWTKHSCSVSCDDSCDPNFPFRCGGWAKMTRGIIVQPDKCGLKCPVQEKYIRCGQFFCPIDCDMSSWSGYSACTAECEGGLQSRTRSILTKPKNGGTQCNTAEESRPCNTMSCDRDCRLQTWTSWSPCAVACRAGDHALGFQERVRHVLIPTRGEGRCPHDHSQYRYNRRTCNTHKCKGDERCIAKQDLVIGLDASGSLMADGFKIVKSFAKTLLSKYEMTYFGQPAMRIGVMLFGNGVLLDDDKTVSPARNLQALTDSMDLVDTAVDGAEYKRGFTNMAQAFSMAEDMFIKKGRKDAQASVLLITDGKPSFAWMTNEMVEQLDDKGIMRYFICVNSQGENSEAMIQMKNWASQPWETNFLHIQGTLLLEADADMWAQTALTMFCPNAYSPSNAWEAEKSYGYAHVKDGGWCGEKDDANLLSKDAINAEACAALAGGGGYESFILGAYFRRGWCYGNSMKVDVDQYNTWQANKVNPECADGWKSSMLYDFYAMEPVGEVE